MYCSGYRYSCRQVTHHIVCGRCLQECGRVWGDALVVTVVLLVLSPSEWKVVVVVVTVW